MSPVCSTTNHLLLGPSSGSHQIFRLFRFRHHSQFLSGSSCFIQGKCCSRGQWKGVAKQKLKIDAQTKDGTDAFSQRRTGSKSRWICKAQGMPRAELTTLASNVAQTEYKQELKALKGNSQQRMNKKIKGAFAQAQLRATFYPKFENEKSDQEVRSRMIDVVHSGKGILEVSLKHSGSLFMYAGDHGGAFAKNSFGNLYSAVGVFVLGRTLQEAWGAQAVKKIREFNSFLEKHQLCISMELVTAVLGDHGQRPLKDYVVVTAVTDLKNKPRFYSTPDLIAFCRKWRLPTNHVWLFSSRKSATSFFTAYDALCEEGTATPVSNILDQMAEISVPATISHTEVQGEILEGLVARIVSRQSTERLQNMVKEFPAADFKGQEQLQPGLREICVSNHDNEAKQVEMLLQNIGKDMCSDFTDWSSSQSDSSMFRTFLNATPADQMTTKLQEMIQVLQERNMQVRYPCRVKEIDEIGGKIHFKLTVHVLQDSVFRRYQKEMRMNPGLWPLYRGFFVDVWLFDDQKLASSSMSPSVQSTLDVINVKDDALADESENLMLKLKFLTYKIRTFLIRNGLSTLFNNGFDSYRKYYLRLMELWGTSLNKQGQLDQLLTEWAGYITRKYRSKQLNERTYLSEAEPFLHQFAERSFLNRQLVGAAGNMIKTKDFLTDLASHVDSEEATAVSKAHVDYKQLSQTLKAKGMIVFFPGIPGCAKSALCRELMNIPGCLGDGKRLHSLMGDMIKGRYWPKLAEERKRMPTMITLADKNAPNEEVWKTIEEMCRSTHAIGVPVVPDSEGTISNPFSLEALAVFIYRVLQRANHPGNLDGSSSNAGFVLMMFYNLYDGKDRREFEESLKRRFGYLVQQPLLRPDRDALPQPVIGLLTQGLELFRRHTTKHGKLESSKGAFREEWSRWEKRLREILFGNAEYLDAIQVPFEEAVQSVKNQLQAIVQGNTSMDISVQGEGTSTAVTYAAISLQPKEIVDVLSMLARSNELLNTYFSGKGIETNLKGAHVTLAHKTSHGVPAVAAYGDLKGFSVPVELTAFLFAKKMCALEVHIRANEHNVSSRNEWPHVTVWTAEGTRPKEANSLPQLVARSQGSRVDFASPFVVSGVVSLL